MKKSYSPTFQVQTKQKGLEPLGEVNIERKIKENSGFGLGLEVYRKIHVSKLVFLI